MPPSERPVLFRALEGLRDLQLAIGRRRHAEPGFRDLVASTDKLLWKLEEMNLRQVDQVSAELRLEIEEAVSRLPIDCRQELPPAASIQELLDSVFDVQARLFRWRHPAYFPADDADDDA